MMFSSGMPFLYVIAAAFYILYFLIYKFLLLKYYARTSKFSEDLPLESLEYMRYGVIFHIVTGLFMYTNHEIIIR